MQSLGATHSSRAPPKAAISAASAAPVSQAASAAGPANGDSAPAESAPASSSHAYSAPSCAQSMESPSAMGASASGQLPAESASATGRADQAQTSGQSEATASGTERAPSTQTAQGSQSTPPGKNSSREHRRNNQQNSSNNGHHQNGQFQVGSICQSFLDACMKACILIGMMVFQGSPTQDARCQDTLEAYWLGVQAPRGSPQAHRWGRGPQAGRGSPGRQQQQQHARHSNAYQASPPHPMQYDVYGPGAPLPAYQASRHLHCYICVCMLGIRVTRDS